MMYFRTKPKDPQNHRVVEKVEKTVGSFETFSFQYSICLYHEIPQ